MEKERSKVRQNQKEMLEDENSVRDEECLWWAHQLTGYGQGKNQLAEDMSIETS